MLKRFVVVLLLGCLAVPCLAQKATTQTGTLAERRRARIVPTNGAVLTLYDNATSAAQAITAFRRSPEHALIRTNAEAANRYQELRRHLASSLDAIQGSVTTMGLILETSGRELESSVYLSTFNADPE